MREFSEQELIRRNKLEKYKEIGVDPFGRKFNKINHTNDLKNKYDSYSKEELEEKNIFVITAGRIMRIRDMGKVVFINIKDQDGEIQIYLNQKNISEKDYEIYQLSDIGDVIGIEGYLMKTKTGELTIKANKYIHLTKSLKPLPEKFHGLVDIEERYRRRYLDLIINEKSREIAIARIKILNTIKSFLNKKGFLEVETPILHPILGGASARPFITHHNALDMDLYLRIAPELYLKRLIVGGLEKVYELNRVFRNEGVSNRHNPEFTMMELYEAYGDMESMIQIVEEIFEELLKELAPSKKVVWRNTTFDFTNGFKKVSMVEMIKEVVGIDFNNQISNEEAVELAKKHNIHLEEHEKTFGHIVNLFFEEFCESKLIEPTILYGHPSEISPLAKRNKNDPRFADRFEIFINQVEFGNSFSELNNPIIQEENFKKQLLEKEKGNVEANEMDLDYVEALEYGLPPTGGLGIGIDRLVMLFTNNDNIREVILFPHLKKID